MRLGGLQKLTLLDFPGHVACTVFTVGCNWRCPFCHNAALACGNADGFDPLDEETFFTFLEKRRGVLDGVAITGGEPLLWQDIGAFMARIRSLGYAVKLDTNGTNPSLLKELCEAGLCDMVAMDIKNSPDKYAETCGVGGVDLDAIRESIAILQTGKVPFEFRTTVVDELHDAEDLEKISRMIQGDEPYFLQAFVDSGQLMSDGWHAPTKEKMKQFREICLPLVPKTELRGVS